MKNLDAVLREKEEQVETLQKEIEALRFVSTLLTEEESSAEASSRTVAASSLASASAPTHVMQSSSPGTSFDREPGGFLGASSGLKQFP